MFTRHVVRQAFRQVKQRRRAQIQRALGSKRGFLHSEHAAHVGVGNDGDIAPIYRALHALGGVGAGVLVGAFGNGVSFNAHVEPRGFHHGEHIRQAFACAPHQIARCAVKLHGAGGAGVDAELVFQAHRVHRIARAQAAVGVEQKFRHDKQRDALHARCRIGQPRQHQMDDVFGELLLAPSNEDFLPRDAVRAVAIGRGLRGNVRQIRTRVGLA